MSKCPFSKILGVPGEGPHSVRLGGYAVVDFVLTIVAAYLTSRAANISFILSFVIWFVVGEIMHVTYGVQTAFLTAVGVKVNCS
jgi:hypothetical protein